MRIPFERALFLKVLTATTTLITMGIVAVVCFQGYILPRDVVGSLLSGLVLSYLIHLWMLPADEDEDADGG